jgi:vacuolar-type H+-ATPase subunit E/Vma4
MSMEKITEAILDKVRKEAQEITADAEEKARERVDRAKEQYQVRFEEQKRKLVEEAEGEAARVRAQALIAAREEMLNVKNEVIEEIVNKVKKALPDVSGGEKLALALIREGLAATGTGKARVYVSGKDVDGVKKLIGEDKELSGKIAEVVEYKCNGGAVVEDIEGRISIDNTFETRLDTLLPRVLPEISKELFGE